MKTKLKKYKNPYKIQWNDPISKELEVVGAKFETESKIETIFLILNEFSEIPICPYTSFPQKFNKQKKEYYGWSGEIQSIVKDDKNIKNKGLTFLSILNMGVPYEKVYFYKLSKKFRKFIGTCTDTPTSRIELNEYFEKFSYLYGINNKDRKYYSRRGKGKNEINQILSKSANTYWSTREKRKNIMKNTSNTG